MSTPSLPTLSTERIPFEPVLEQVGLFPERIQHEISQAQLERLLLWCVGQGVSDIVFCPGDPVWMQLDGVWQQATDSALTAAETQNIVNDSSGQSNRAGLVKTGKSIDYAYAVRIPGLRTERQRFRVNATSSNKGIYVVMRALPRQLPKLEDIEGLEPELQKALYPASGLVVVSGVMGSGKSTLLAAIMHSAILSHAVGRQILTLEDPIEFDFASIPAAARTAPITQSAIHIDVTDWPSGVRTMTRRKGEIVMVGESRDEETLAALLGCVEQGVTAYTTVHAQDVPQTITRMVNAFPEEKRASVASILKANLRLIIHQRLVPRRRSAQQKANGVKGRIALREYLVLDENLRRYLYRVPHESLVPEIRRLVSTFGQSLIQDATNKYKAGLIHVETYEAIRHEQETTALSESLQSQRNTKQTEKTWPQQALVHPDPLLDHDDSHYGYNAPK